jgi:RimJ/RimL family protein N-acetyltransferase
MKRSWIKETLLSELPIGEDPIRVRTWTRSDLDTLAAWPKYPFPYEGFAFGFVSMNPKERSQLFDGWNRKPGTIPLVVDLDDHPAIGYLCLTQIDGSEGRVGNLGFRIHPDWVNRGVGTKVLHMVCRWCFDCGVTSIRVDVAASNARAVRCYEKVGFCVVGSLWRDAIDLKGVDITAPRYDFLRPHLCLDGDVPKLRFALMEITLTTLR